MSITRTLAPPTDTPNGSEGPTRRGPAWWHRRRGDGERFVREADPALLSALRKIMARSDQFRRPELDCTPEEQDAFDGWVSGWLSRFRDGLA